MVGRRIATLGLPRLRSLDMSAEVAALLTPIPPWLFLATLLGVVNAAGCFMLVGRRTAHLPLYALIGSIAAPLGQVFAVAAQVPSPVSIGELNVVAVSLAACLLTGGARAARG